MANAKKQTVQVQPVVVLEQKVKTIESTTPAGVSNCIVCGKQITLVKVVYSDGRETILPSHGRCDKCQTIHLCNVRMDKLLTAHKHIAAMAKRLTAEERQICLDVAIDSFNSKVVTALSATQETVTKVKQGFNLAAMVK